jgi:hypothetical protein
MAHPDIGSNLTIDQILRTRVFDWAVFNKQLEEDIETRVAIIRSDGRFTIAKYIEHTVNGNSRWQVADASMKVIFKGNEASSLMMFRTLEEVTALPLGTPLTNDEVNMTEGFTWPVFDRMLQVNAQTPVAVMRGEQWCIGLYLPEKASSGSTCWRIGEKEMKPVTNGMEFHVLRVFKHLKCPIPRAGGAAKRKKLEPPNTCCMDFDEPAPGQAIGPLQVALELPKPFQNPELVQAPVPTSEPVQALEPEAVVSEVLEDLISKVVEEERV